ncbi:MAG: hypothetical protein ACRDRU_26535 [Pseudonocardiaceae bacterium]
MTMNLSGPDFFEWMGLRRVRQGGLARGAGHHYDHGNPLPGWLIPDGLLQDGLLELGDPDQSSIRPVALTETGQAHYRVLYQRQRRKDPAAPSARPAPPRPRPVTG